MNTLSSDISKLVGRMIIVGLKGHDEKDAYNFFEENRNYPVGGIILYDEDITTIPSSPHNIRSPEQLKDFTKCLQDLSPDPLIIGIDQEGGKVNRLKKNYGFKDSTSMAAIGDIDDLERTATESNRTVQTLKECGINLNFSPVLDLNISKENIITAKERAISSNPNTVTNHARIIMNCHHENKVIAVGKHFPGQGSSIGDTHEGWVDVTNSWSKEELIPYKNLIDSNDILAVMTSHLFNKNLDAKYPATISKKIIDGLLRKKLNFKGVVISDDPQMKALSKKYSLKKLIELMLNAGVDIFCFGNNMVYDASIVKKIHCSVLELINEKRVQISMLQRANKRITTLRNMIGLK